MLKNLSSKEVAWILDKIGITLKRHSKEDVFAGYYDGKNRVAIVPRNKRNIPQGRSRKNNGIPQDARVFKRGNA